MVGGHLSPGFYKRRRTDNTVFTNGRPIDNHRAHTDQRITANYATVQNGTVADMPVFFHHRVLARETVHYAVILNIRAIFHHDTTKIAAQASVRTHVNPFAEDHIANQYGGWMNIAFVRYDGDHSVHLVNRHGFSCYASANPPKR
ncbi:hypothetical protein D3C73_1179910 [compost metagenome]